MVALSEVELRAKINEQFVEIPSGEEELRDDRINEKWIVKIDAFYLSSVLVTQELYDHVINKKPSGFKGNTLPVECITWLDAVMFCNTLSRSQGLTVCYSINENETVLYDKTADGYRLPTEAEWQYACKAGTTGVRYGNLDDIAWYKNNSNNSTHEVGQKAPNPWGLYDMLGNVWEWCSDLYDTEVYGTYRIFRGGGWCDEERGVMATTRRRSHPTKFKIDDLGFRIARNK